MYKLGNMGDTFPPRNLGEGERWGRHVEVRVNGIERSLNSLGETLGNGNKTLTARAESIGDQIGRIVSQQEELELQQDVISGQQEVLEVQQRSLQAQQDTLESQQEALEQQQIQLTSVVNAIPVTTARTGSDANFVIGNGTTNYGVQHINVPDGKTKCSIFATGQCIYYTGDIPQVNMATWRIRFTRTDPTQTSVGAYGPVVPMNMDVKTSTFSHSADFTNLTPGSQIFVEAQSVSGQVHPAPYEVNSVSFHAMITFYN